MSLSARCGSLGPMVCLNGAVCNETTGLCMGCPAGYSDDQVFFRGNVNCGLRDGVITGVYIAASVLGWLTSIIALTGVIGKKRTKMRHLLLLIAVWCGLIPLYMLAHWQEGFKHGVGSAFMLTFIILLANSGVAYFTYTLENFVQLVTGNGKTTVRVKRFHIFWYGLWSTAILLCGLVEIGGAAEGNARVFNGGQVALGCTLVIEIAANIFLSDRINRRLVRNVADIHQDVKTDKLNPVVREFAERVNKSRWIGPAYGLIITALGFTVPSLYARFDSSVPYAFVFWSILVLTWPMIGLAPILILRTKLGKQIDKSQSRTATGSPGKGPNGESASNPAPNSPKSPTASTKHRKTIVEETAAGILAVPSMVEGK